MQSAWRPPEELKNDLNLIVNLRKRTPKPVMVINSHFFSPEEVQKARDVTRKLQDGGVPVFATVERGAQALANALEYYRFRNGNSTQT